MTQSYHKICATCQKEKPVTAFHRMSASPDGYRPTCKVCRKERDRQPKVLAQRPLLVFSKVCTACTQEKPIAQFNRMNSTKDGYHIHCKQCQSDYNRKLRQANHEHYQAYDKSRAKSPERRAQWNERYRESYAQNPRRSALKKQSAQHRRKENPFKAREYVYRRIARKKHATSGPVDYQLILERDGNFCSICQSPILPHQAIDFDHVIPLSRGGAHSEDNIRVAHRVCNRRKNNRLPNELTDWDRRGIH